MRCRLASLITFALAAIATLNLGHARDAQAATYFDLTTPGPRGPVTVIGDSVLNGAGVFGPTLPDQLADRGWGPIRFRAAGSATSGLFPVSTEFRSSYWIDLWQSQGWDPKHVIVNLGTNDSGFCRTDPACTRATIEHLLAAIGPGHEVWWPTITKPAAASSRNTFNAVLHQLAAERDDLHVWDWFGEFHSGGYQSGDGIHLHPDSYRRRSARMADEFTNTFARAMRTGGDVALPEPTAPASRFAAVEPRRIVDTRSDESVAIAGGGSLRVDLTGHVPTDATAVALYVASARSEAAGFLASGPCGTPPSGATVNFATGVPAGAPTVVALGDAGDVCIFASEATDVIVDIQGYFSPGADGLAMSPLATPLRLRDTRSAGGPSTGLRVVVREGVEAVAVNLAVVGATGPGYLSAAPCGVATEVANVNFVGGPPTSASALVPVVGDEFCVTASQPVDIVVDLTAEFTGGGSLVFVPVAPVRTLDTRDGTGGWEPVHGTGQTIDVGVAPSDARAVTGTLTAIRPASSAFVTASGCSTAAPTASANVGTGMIAANSLTTATPEGRLCIYASDEMQTVFDTAGWWIPAL